MNAIVIEHVKVGDLPEVWRAKLNTDTDTHVTVRIEEEPTALEAAAKEETATAFGMWRDRDDLAEPAGYVRQLRAPRFERDQR